MPENDGGYLCNPKIFATYAFKLFLGADNVAL